MEERKEVGEDAGEWRGMSGASQGMVATGSYNYQNQKEVWA